MLAALAGALLVAVAGARLVGAATRLASLEREWLARATPSPAAAPGLPVFIVDGPGRWRHWSA